MFRLAHLSDPHLGPLPEVRLRQLASKRVLGYVNWQRNRAVRLGNTALDALMADIAATAPDHVAVTGDLVNLALPAELTAAAAWLRSIGPADRVSVVPGNHDAYVPGAARKAARLWAPFMTGDSRDAAADEPPVPQTLHGEDAMGVRFPFVRRRGAVAIVGTSTARASAPFMATGHFGTTQSLLLAEALERLGREGYFRVVLIHHPPVRGSTAWYKRLIGGTRFREAIRQSGAELVLHGHNHRAGVRLIRGPEGPVPVVGVPSASAQADGHHEAARYNLFEIDGAPGAWRCQMEERGLTLQSPSAVTTIARQTLS